MPNELQTVTAEDRPRVKPIAGPGGADGGFDRTAPFRRALLYRFIRSPLGAFFARPWFSRLSHWFLINRYFPLSRLWAAADGAEGSLEKFLRETGIEPRDARERSRIETILDDHERARDAAAGARRAWEDAFFGEGEHTPAELVGIERRRRGASHHHMMRRFAFRRLIRGRAIANVRWNVPGETAVTDAYGAQVDEPEKAFRPPSRLPAIERSRAIPSSVGRKYWLRFRSPSKRVGGLVYAAVHEPAGVEDPPTIVFGHGVGVENDLWRETIDSVLLLVAEGVRVIEINGPWHGLRAVPGRYGGEPFFAGVPLSALDLFSAEVREMGILVGWARANGGGKVGVGGVSLGALVAQLAVVHSDNWPKAMRPDSALLITHAGLMKQTAAGGALSRGIGIPQAMEAAGWTEEAFERWRPLTDPIGAPAVPPESIVSVLASLDDVTPFDSGLSLVRDWGLPERNLFVIRQGHFSAPMALLRDRRCYARFARIMDAR